MKDIQIIREYDGTLPCILLDKHQMQQVLVNIISNAVDAMPGGGKIFIKTGKSGNQWEISIRDTGTGMNSEILKHIFEPFFTTKEIGKGTGLGLSLCYEIIRKHNGIISVESETGKGTTFRIKLNGDNRKE